MFSRCSHDIVGYYGGSGGPGGSCGIDGSCILASLVGLVGLRGHVGLLGLVGLLCLIGWIGLDGPVGLVSIVGLVGMVGLVGPEILSLMIQKNLMILKSLIPPSLMALHLLAGSFEAGNFNKRSIFWNSKPFSKVRNRNLETTAFAEFLSHYSGILRSWLF